MRLHYHLITQDPVVVSQTSATTNNHQCLDYIPGSAMLGALASRLYSVLESQAAWQVFHSGQVRFGPCYPVVDGQLALPTPASWHYQKGQKVIEEQQYQLACLSNHGSVEFDRDSEANKSVQFKQCRDGYINANGHAANVKQTLVTKTQIDPTKGTAKESQLFSYSAINEGQSFAGWIDVDDGLDAEIIEQIKTHLCQPLRIGRSRNSEFGRVSIELLDDVPQTSTAIKEPHLTLWCLSDCEFIDHTGMPALAPSLAQVLTGTDFEALGLAPDCVELEPSLSFIRSHSVSRFNQKRAGLDSEQSLVSQGSVLVYKFTQLPPPEALKKLQQRLAQGVGINCQHGLGWVAVNPEWAQQQAPSAGHLFQAQEINIAHHDVQPDMQSTLVSWVDEQLGEQTQHNLDKLQVTSMLQALVNAYYHARRYNNILNSNEAGPSSTQWRRIATRVREDSAWMLGVFEGEHKICNPKNDELGWGIQWQLSQAENNRPINFADFVQGLLMPKDHSLSNGVMRHFIENVTEYDLSSWTGLNKLAKQVNIKLQQEAGDE